ncbi:MAG: hypothetical protein KC491_01240 [Dehalococcoidia bacterium]|nr:hypothetical protein [Dehalococcoidia bacterium]
MAISAPERQYLLSQVGRLADSDLLRLWRAAELSDVDFFAFVVDGFPDLVDPYHQAAAMLAANWFEESLPASTYVARVIDPLPVEKLASSARWALGGDGEQGLARLQGTLQRAVFDGARDTTLLNVQATGSGWARYASATACEFCRMLATRGSAYRSRDTAATKVHDHCSCIPVEDRDNSYEPPDYVAKWQDEYIAARTAAGSGDTKEILAAWRQLGV